MEIETTGPNKTKFTPVQKGVVIESANIIPVVTSNKENIKRIRKMYY